VGNYGRFFYGMRLLSQVCTTDEHCPGTLISVIIQNVNETGQSVAKL